MNRIDEKRYGIDSNGRATEIMTKKEEIIAKCLICIAIIGGMIWIG